MARIIVDFPNGLDTESALTMVRNVVAEGKVSMAYDRRGKKVPHYCWCTVFTVFNKKFYVLARRKKLGQKSDSFRIQEEERNA